MEKICKKCKTQFLVTPEEIVLYEKNEVPVIDLCFECKMRNLYAYRNERRLYRRPCDLCNQSTVSIYSSDKPFKVFCPPCWWSDGWDAKQYGKDFDFTRPFFEQFRELQLEAPRIALLTKNSTNSEYTNHAGENKDAYLSFAVFGSENIVHSSNIWARSRDCVDCTMITDLGSLCYECIDCEKINQSQYCLQVYETTDCYYSFDLRNCSNCFMSYNLRNQSYCIRNIKYSKEEYQQEIAKYNLKSYAVRQKLYNEWLEMIKDSAIHKYAVIERCVDSTGNTLYNSKNAKNYFDADKVEDSMNAIVSPHIRDSIDNYHVGLAGSEKIYNSHGVVRSANIICCHLSYDNSYISYCDSSHNSNNLFGCIALKKSNYCIFNKQYSKEEYIDLKNKIIEHMKNTGEYGYFFPPEIAPVYYNETQAQVYMPLTKEEAITKGFLWADSLGGVYGKETVTDIPDELANFESELTKEVFKCESCTKNYNVVLAELELYKRMSVPLPHLCADCRYLKRIGMRLPRKLWTRICSNKSSTEFNNTACQNVFKTSYSPDRQEKVYCESCYKREVL